MAIIESEQTIILTVVIVVAVVLSVLSERFKVGKVLTSALVAMILGAFFVNMKLIPDSAPVYGVIYSSLVPIALPLFLYDADWKRVFIEAGHLVKLFGIAVLGVLIGALLASKIVDLGGNTSAWASVFSASFTGGTVNFVAVSTALELPESEIAVALTADTLAGMFFLALLIVLSTVKMLGYILPKKPEELSEYMLGNGPAAEERMEHIAFAAAGLGVSVVIYFVAKYFSHVTGTQAYLALWVTAITLLLANLFPSVVSKLRSGFSVGIWIMLAFFFVVGASASLYGLQGYVISFLALIGVMLLSHIIVLLIAAKTLGFTLSETLIVSCSCVLGPTVAAGMAANKRWDTLVTPGIVLGISGYAIGNFLGLAMARLLTLMT